jgi:urease accessory protein
MAITTITTTTTTDGGGDGALGVTTLNGALRASADRPPPADRHGAPDTAADASAGPLALATPAAASVAPEEPAPDGMPALLRLLQLSSSLCPIGAFAYSQGLETAIERGWVGDEASLASWLSGLGEHGVARLDLPLLYRAHDAALRWDEARLFAIAERMLANREARELVDQERQLGSALASVLENLGMARAAVFKGHPSASYVVSFAAGAAFFGIGAELALTGYCFAWSEQQVSAAARLGPLGHMAAQRALSAVLRRAPSWVAQARALPDERIGSSTFGLAMCGAWHETQYTRLFRS